jgi:hypothetical protein
MEYQKVSLGIKLIATASFFVVIIIFSMHAKADNENVELTGKTSELSSSTVMSLKEIALKSGDSSIKVSSANRSAIDQIKIALEAYGSAEEAKKIYALPCRNAFDYNTEDEMVAALIKILTDNPERGCMRHVESRVRA